ncbi:hypothetical protein DES53_101523 [Roseimicrobium gellanilyticum]|uniref:Uncharacterized protein n=1 Tax=Roseimicrobium gellanilyticum TaxID=748857 RepID=A0A366HVW0_9BACT|nr:hypothetical protein [Roseimicrobium gellanilyticum]RBP47724.1 hypothetical protein DES53_101523 [Roseimicrobium gellanilyticum]
MNNLKDSFPRVWPVLRLVLQWSLVLLPAVGLFLLIREFGVNIPFLDDWMYISMFEKERAGTLTLHDFFMVQMEHRMAFVRAMMLVFYKVFPGNWTIHMFFSWLLLALTYVNVGLLLKKTTGQSFRVWWPLLVLAGLTIFCPVQYRVVLWSMMFQVAALGFFLSGALLAIMSGLPLWLRWIIGIVCASLATQCFASGILVWLLPLPLVWFTPAVRGLQARIIFTTLWLAVFAVTMQLYFTNLVNEVEPMFAYKQGEEETMRKDVGGMIKDPGRTGSYVFRFLGNHLSRGSSFSMMDVSLVIGGVSFALYVVAFGYLLGHWRREELRAQLGPWLVFGAYSIGTGVLVAMGRSWASSTGDNAIAPRYVIHAVPLTVALIALVWIIAQDVIARRPEMKVGARRFILQSGMALLAVLILSWAQGWRLMDMWHSSRLRGAVNTRFYNVLYQVEDMVPANRDHARRAEKMGLLNPPMLKDRMLSNFRLQPSLLSSNTANFRSMKLSLEEVKKGREKDDAESPDTGATIEANAEAQQQWVAQVEGFACLRGRNRVADGVFFTRRVPETGAWEIFHVVQVSGMPLYLFDMLNKDTQFVHVPSGHIAQDGLAGFTGTFVMTQLPPGVHDIMAWAYDAHEDSVYPMAPFYQLDNRGPTPRVKRLGVDPASVHISKFLKKKQPAEKGDTKAAAE